MNVYIKKNTWLGATLLGCLILVSPAQAASFDCGKATSKIEKLICGDDELSKIDETLSEAYLQALKKSEDKQKATKYQRQWLKEVRNTCQDAECIKNVSNIRIKELNLVHYGIFITSASDHDTSIAKGSEKLPKSQTIEQPAETPRTQVGQQHISTSTSDCDTSIVKNLGKSPTPKIVSQLVEISRAQLAQQQFECVVQTLEQANREVRTVDDGGERAAMGFEIKDVAFSVIQQNKISDPAIEKRLVWAAIQSIDSNGKLIKTASEDERFNDTAFLGSMSDHYNRQERYVDYRQVDLTMLRLNFSLPANRRWVDRWRMTNFLADQGRKGYLSEVAELLESAQGDVLQSYRSELVAALLQAAGGLAFRHDLISIDKAKQDIEALLRLYPMFKGESWGFQMYLYMAEAYWQLGHKDKAHDNLDKARAIIQDGGNLFSIAKFLCTKSMSCPFGIYDSVEMSALLDEIEKLANTDRYIKNNLDKIQSMRINLSHGVSQ